MVKKNPLKEVLERIFWALPEERRKDMLVYITHRGAFQDVKLTTLDKVVRFSRGYIYMSSDDLDGVDYSDEVPIPFHRILKIHDKVEDETLYEKKSDKEKND